MPQITFKTKHEPSQMVKNLGAVMFNIFAQFFNWFVIIICLTIFIAGYWWLIKPKYDFIASGQELTFRELEYEDKVRYLKQLNEVKNLYKNIGQSDKDKVDLILSAQQDLDRLKITVLREVSQLGKDQSIIMNNIVIVPIDNSTGKFISIVAAPTNNPLLANLQLVDVTFVVQGVDYAALQKLLSRLEKSLRIMDVTKMNFDPASRQASIEFETYYLKH